MVIRSSNTAVLAMKTANYSGGCPALHCLTSCQKRWIVELVSRMCVSSSSFPDQVATRGNGRGTRDDAYLYC